VVDVSLVLDELTSKWKGAWLVDPSRIAMAGHSIGGASSIAAVLADSRVRAGVDIDGTTCAPIPDTGLSRPVLLLRVAGSSPVEHVPHDQPRSFAARCELLGGAEADGRDGQDQGCRLRRHVLKVVPGNGTRLLFPPMVNLVELFYGVG
jgi:dienelactone hydrolase